MRNALAVGLAVSLLCGCSGDERGGGFLDLPEIPVLWVTARGQQVADEFRLSVTIRAVGWWGEAVEDAIVTLNGEPVPHVWDGRYAVVADLDLTPGDPVTLSIASGATSVSAAVLWPEQPVIVSPTPAGSPYDSLQTIAVQWLPLSPAPELVHVGVAEVLVLQNTGRAGSGLSWQWVGLGTDTATAIPAGTFSEDERQLAGNETDVIVEAVARLERFDCDADLVLDVGNPTVGSFTTTP